MVSALGVVNISLSSIRKAGKYTFHAEIDGNTKNEWDIWIYPTTENPMQDLKLTRNWQEAKTMLEKGESVCFVPKTIMGRKTHFASHFWNPIMFNWDPMIVGTCIHNQHPVFHNFPTAEYADWQWWDILNYAGAVDLTAMTELTPIIQSVDTYEVNRKLGIAFEAQVGKGKLFFLNLDISKNINERKATKQLLKSVKEYIDSAEFKSTNNIPMYQLDALFSADAKKEKQTQGNAAIQQLLNQ